MTKQVLHELYSQAFFEALRAGSQQSAAVIGVHPSLVSLDLRQFLKSAYLLGLDI